MFLYLISRDLDELKYLITDAVILNTVDMLRQVYVDLNYLTVT